MHAPCRRRGNRLNSSCKPFCIYRFSCLRPHGHTLLTAKMHKAWSWVGCQADKSSYCRWENHDLPQNREIFWLTAAAAATSTPWLLAGREATSSGTRFPSVVFPLASSPSCALFHPALCLSRATWLCAQRARSSSLTCWAPGRGGGAFPALGDPSPCCHKCRFPDCLKKPALYFC